jgi:spore coat polysaccharide biosynthesis predicted glycosyltransferase SpsG
MTRAPVLFRVDAAPGLGYEHLSRSLVYAAALQRRRRPAYFLSQLEPASLGLTVKRGGNEWLLAHHPAGTDDDLAETMAEVRRLGVAAVVVDAPAVNEDYLDRLRDAGILVVSFDSIAQACFTSHMVVNPLLGPTKEQYDHGRGTQLLLGQRYAIIRPEVRRCRPLRAQEPGSPYRALVALGDDDPNNQSGALAELLLECPRVNKVYVAVRPYHPNLAELKELADKHGDRLEIASEPGEYPPKVVRSHFAVTAGNAWSLELACVGVPQLLVVQSETHWPTAQRLEEEGAATCLGWHANVSAKTLYDAVEELTTDPMERQGMARCGRRLIDGRGPDRLVTALEILLQPMRKAEIEHPLPQAA